jgi:antitoxin component YwqK of YwqJK toxin-antitoxin module
MQDKHKQPYNEKGERHGLWHLYWGDNSLCSKTNYVNGERCGFREFYYMDGELSQKKYYAR